MPGKDLRFGAEARRELERGVDRLANAVRITLGPRGRNVVLAKKVASKTNDVAGDGTTTATVLAQSMVHEGVRNVTSGSNPMSLRRGINAGVEAAVEALRGQSKEVADREQIAHVASVSAADAEVGDMIADAM